MRHKKPEPTFHTATLAAALQVAGVTAREVKRAERAKREAVMETRRRNEIEAAWRLLSRDESEGRGHVERWLRTPSIHVRRRVEAEREAQRQIEAIAGLPADLRRPWSSARRVVRVETKCGR